MLLPRFSVRQILLVMVVLAAFFTVAARAVQGVPWAVGLSVAIASLLVIVSLHAIFFAFAWFVARITLSVENQPKPTSPFVDSKKRAESE